MNLRSRSVLLSPLSLLLLFPALLAGSTGRVLAQANCSKTQTHKTPLNDLGTGVYLGYEGGLYPLGSNVRPLSHEQALDRTGRMMLLDGLGLPDAVNGKLVLISIGMSNATQEFSTFIRDLQLDPRKNSRLELVDCAQPGQTSDIISDPLAAYWQHVDETLAAAGVTDLQVGSVWLKEAREFPQEQWPDSATVFQDDLRSIVQILKSRFPNLRSVYHSSRIYGGYGPNGVNPEPYPYQYGFAVKWLLAEQLSGSAALNFDPAKGAVTAPWMSWGPYLWADGMKPRSDGLTWECQDFEQGDGIHPSPSGEEKVSQMLISFFKTDATTKSWFVDCNLVDHDVFGAPPEVFGDRLRKIAGGAVEVAWDSLDPVVGLGTVYDVTSGRMSDLRADRGFSRATCLTSGLADTPYVETQPVPAPGDGYYYVVRGRNSCATGTWGDGRTGIATCP